MHYFDFKNFNYFSNFYIFLVCIYVRFFFEKLKYEIMIYNLLTNFKN